MIPSAALDALDAEFAKLKDNTLRMYLRAHRRGSREWDHAHVVKLLETFQVPPYDRLEVRPRMSKCGCEYQRVYTVVSLPGRSRHKCDSCRLEWVEVDGS